MTFNEWIRGNRNRNRNNDNNNNNTNSDSGSNYEFYEDTHDEHGNYIGAQRQFNSQNVQSQQPSMQHDPKGQKIYVSSNVSSSGAKSFGNIADYRPTTIEEVATLINFLKKGEPAIANLNKAQEGDAQRILDFLSGAIFALNGNIHRIHDNIFLLSPEGVEIQSYADRK